MNILEKIFNQEVKILKYMAACIATAHIETSIVNIIFCGYLCTCNYSLYNIAYVFMCKVYL